jgi:hypothetical protein
MGVFTLTSRPLKRNEQRRQVRYLSLIIFGRKVVGFFITAVREPIITSSQFLVPY